MAKARLANASGASLLIILREQDVERAGDCASARRYAKRRPGWGRRRGSANGPCRAVGLRPQTWGVSRLMHDDQRQWLVAMLQLNSRVKLDVVNSGTLTNM